MQTSIRIFFIVVTAVLFLNFKWRSITCYLKGHIRNSKSSFVVLNKLHVYVKSNGRILDSTITDKHGNFELQFNTNTPDRLFRFYCFQSGKGIIQLKTVSWFESDTPEMTFYIPAKKLWNK